MRITIRCMLPGMCVCLLVSAAVPVRAQNGYSFLRVDQSAVRYAEVVAQPVAECEAFRSQTSAAFSVTGASEVPGAGEVPGHCRIDGVIAPEVGFQVNLPRDWNGRIYMYGNGGYAGEPPDDPRKAAARDAALGQHFATVYTNTGHDARAEPLATFAFNNLQKELDYAYRAVHLTIGVARSFIADFYGRAADHAYWDGCSTGGRQGLMSAQRFPDDFDGIIAGAPVLNLTATQTSGVWNGRALAGTGLTPDHVALVGAAVYAKCDALDGLEDGLIRDPRACDFDPARDVPRCRSRQTDACLTVEQSVALQKIYGGVISRGEVYFPGLPVGAERGGWVPWLLNPDGPSVQYSYGETAMKYLVFAADDPDFAGTDLDFDADIERMAMARQLLDATDPDLSRFRSRGGKILSYFGWADPALNPMMGVDYYEAVIEELGFAETRDFFRLYMVPGMFHCRGGLGVDRIDAMTPLIDWVEHGIIPERIDADRLEDGTSVRSRPVCPYPEVAVYSGSGSIDAAVNFRCGKAELK